MVARRGGFAERLELDANLFRGEAGMRRAEGSARTWRNDNKSWGFTPGYHRSPLRG